MQPESSLHSDALNVEGELGIAPSTLNATESRLDFMEKEEQLVRDSASIFLTRFPFFGQSTYTKFHSTHPLLPVAKSANIA